MLCVYVQQNQQRKCGEQRESVVTENFEINKRMQTQPDSEIIIRLEKYPKQRIWPHPLPGVGTLLHHSHWTAIVYDLHTTFSYEYRSCSSES